MGHKVFLVHGWSVTETTTYQALHLKLAEHGFELEEIFLGRYVSLDDRVEIKDISRAMHRELRRRMGPPPWSGAFHLITHSTGALVVKDWIARDYTGKFAQNKPLKNVVFLAGPHFGSRLAHHGRSMLAHAAYFGATGNRVLTALELGSDFSWDVNGKFLERETWRDKGIRLFNLIGDKVEPNAFKSKIFPAGYEKGSDMVVRVPSGNLNFRRFAIDGVTKTTRKVGEIKDIPFAALADYVHSGKKAGIVASITKSSRPKPSDSLTLDLILRCLDVSSKAAYDKLRVDLAAVTRKTRKKRQAFAQLDFRFRDETGAPIEDYSFELGAIVKGKDKPSKTIANTHKNVRSPSQFTVFIDLTQFEPKLTYFMNFSSDSGTDLYRFDPTPLRVVVEGKQLAEILSPEQTTQVDVRLARVPSDKLFVFHPGTDPDLHVEWNREGDIVDRKLEIK
jgi:hypothetical protein